MKTIRIILLFLLLGNLVSGQAGKFEKPNYRKIEKHIRQKKSGVFYPLLMQRYLAADTTMTMNEKQCLYYGYVFQPGYSPYNSPACMDSAKFVLRKDSLTAADYERIIQYSGSVLAKYPLSIRALNYQIFALEQKNDQQKFTRRLSQLKIIMSALLNSGNGLRKENAFYVIDMTHAYEILDLLNLPFGGAQYLMGHYAYLELGKNNRGLKGLYFEVSPCLHALDVEFFNRFPQFTPP